MKKIITLIITLATASWPANAQLQLSFGPGAGLNYNIHSSSLSDNSFTHFGALITSQLDVQFSRSLALLVWVDFYSDMSALYSVNYFSIAPTIKYCIMRSPFYLFGGPGIGIRTGGDIYYDIPDTRIDIRMGAGYEFFLSNRLTLTPFAAFNVGMNEADWQMQALPFGLVLRYNFSK